MNKAGRIHWIDATKGILIILMVIGHIPNLTGKHGYETTFFSKIMILSSIYTCFFMQAFLILSGYTSNFSKDFRPFLVSQIKTILVPWILFSLIYQLFRFLSGGGYFINIGGQNFLFFLEDFWFLHVLFFSKLFYFFLYKQVKADWIRGFVFLLILILGFFIFSNYGSVENSYHYYNYLHYKDFLCMAYCIWIGNVFRRYDLLSKIKGTTLLIVCFIFIFVHGLRLAHIDSLPDLLFTPVAISHSSNVSSMIQLPVYLFYVLFGSLTCFGFMQYLGSNRLLEFFGVNSLVVYCVHFGALNLVIDYIYKVIRPNSIANAVGYLFITLVTVLLFCTLFIRITKYRPFNYLVGKF